MTGTLPPRQAPLGLDLSPCHRCGAPVMWRVTWPNGARIPLDPAPLPAGAPRAWTVVGQRCFSKITGDRGLLAFWAERSAALGQDVTALDTADYPRYAHHFGTCPNPPGRDR